MQICIAGAGGLGTLLAAFLGATAAEAGETVEITLFVRPAHAAAYEEPVAVLHGPRELRAPVRLATEPHGLPPFDYLLLCVKARDSEAALAALQGIEVETAISFQNGMRKDEALLRQFGAARVAGGVTMAGGELLRPGHSRLMSTGATLLGELAGSSSARTERLARLLDRGGLPAASVPAIITREWQKLVTFLPGALVNVLSRTDMATSLLDPELARLRLRLGREIAAVATAEGRPLGTLPVFLNAAAARPSAGPVLPGFDRPDEEILAAFARQGEALRAAGALVYPSLKQDVEAGRPNELEATAGDMLLRAARLGVPAPALQSCTELVRGLQPREGANSQ